MASLVLSATGAAIAGPSGGVIGSFLGREIDGSFRGGSRARLSDRRVPTSHYGDPIPNIRGRMRVSGMVLWSATPVAAATLSKFGAGQGSSVSFALGLSSGPVERVSRVWADGRLILDDAGRQAVAFTMRLHNGDEDQVSDPLIASVLGEDQAPAFRDIAYAVFENFDLSSFGSRLPLITVELASDEQPLTAEHIIESALCLAGTSPVAHQIEGFAQSGDERAAAIAPLCEAFGATFAFASDGWKLEQSTTHHVIDPRLWHLKLGPRVKSVLTNVGEAPSRVSLRYFDPAIDFAASEKSARLPGPERLRRIELPAALTADHAKAAAFEQLRRSLDDVEQTWLTLPITFARIRLGDQLSCEGESDLRYTICEKVLSSGELNLRVKRQSALLPTLAADAGGSSGIATFERAPLAISLIELPGDIFESEPELAILASGGFQPFEAMPIVLQAGGTQQNIQSARFSAPAGHLLEDLPPGPPDLIDWRNEIRVKFDQDPVLTSCHEDSLLAGANLVQVGGEFVQFSIAQPLGNSIYRLAGLLRGRFDSANVTQHSAGTTVLLLLPEAMTKVKLARDCIGSRVSAQVEGPDDDVAEASLDLGGIAAKPWAPDHLSVEETAAGLRLSRVRRCREGTSWLDEVDVPLAPKREVYVVRLSDNQNHDVQLETSSPEAVIGAQSQTDFGPKPWRLEVRQLGDFAAGNPLIHNID